MKVTGNRQTKLYTFNYFFMILYEVTYVTYVCILNQSYYENKKRTKKVYYSIIVNNHLK